MAHNLAVGRWLVAHAFPSRSWLAALVQILNSDERFADRAGAWEGAVIFVIEADPTKNKRPFVCHLDLWHGKCRGASVLEADSAAWPESEFTLIASGSRFVEVLKGELDPMQAMLTRKLKVKGNMGYMLKNIPAVLEFVRCARSVEIEGQ